MILMANQGKGEKKVICHDYEGKEFKVPAAELKFRPAVYAVIIKDGKVLFSRMLDGYVFPGGAVETGETFEDALKREIHEETGLQAKVGELVEFSDSFFRLPVSKRFVHAICAYYLCEITGGKLSTEFFDENEKKYAALAEWIDADKVGKLKFYNAVDSPKLIRKAQTRL